LAFAVTIPLALGMGANTTIFWIVNGPAGPDGPRRDAHLLMLA
jgi:hypothetical protein